MLLRPRVARRVDAQFARGVVAEVAGTHRRAACRPPRTRSAAWSTGRSSRCCAACAIERATRALIVQENMRYARRQLMWFRKEADVRLARPGAGEAESTVEAASSTGATLRAIRARGSFILHSFKLGQYRRMFIVDVHVLSRVVLIVMDSVGAGELPDAARYGDEGSDTLGNIARAVGLNVPDAAIAGSGARRGHRSAIRASRRAARSAAWPKRRRARTPSRATGKWRASCSTSRSRRFRTAFRRTSSASSSARIGRADARQCRRRRARRSSTRSGPSTLRTGAPIVYTSADSVFQIAAHEVGDSDRRAVPHVRRRVRSRRRAGMGVGRVIARPFVGDAGRVHAHDQPPRLRAASRSADAARSPDGGRAPGRRHRQDRGSVRRPRHHARHSHDVRRPRHGRGRGGDGADAARPDLREPRRLRHASTDIATTCAGYAANLERFDARLARLLPRLRAGRPAGRDRRSRQRSDHAVHGSFARARAGAADGRTRARRCRSGHAADVRGSGADAGRRLRRAARSSTAPASSPTS